MQKEIYSNIFEVYMLSVVLLTIMMVLHVLYVIILIILEISFLLKTNKQLYTIINTDCVKVEREVRSQCNVCGYTHPYASTRSGASGWPFAAF